MIRDSVPRDQLFHNLPGQKIPMTPVPQRMIEDIQMREPGQNTNGMNILVRCM